MQRVPLHGELLPRLDAVCPQIAELRLIPVQLQHLSPQGWRGAIHFPPRRTQQVQVVQIQPLEIRQRLFLYRFSPYTIDLAGQLYRLRCRLYPAAYGGLVVPIAQTIQPDKPLTIRRTHSDVLYIDTAFYLVPHAPQLPQEVRIAVRPTDSLVHITAHHIPQGCPSVALRLILALRRSVLGRLDDGQSMLTAQGVRHTANTLVVVAEGVAVHLPVHKGHSAEHHMIVQVRPVQMGGYHHLIPPAQKTLRQLYTDGMGLLRRHLAGVEGLDHMIAFADTVLLAPAPRRLHHVLIGGVSAAVDGCLEAYTLRLAAIQRVVHRCFQIGLFLVGGIAETLIQPAPYNDDLRIGH